MKVNEGTLDRAIRIVLGIGAGVGAAFVGVTLWMIILAVFGAWVFFTGATGVCPGYRLLGIDTLRAAPATPSEVSGKVDTRHGAHAA